IGDRWGDLDWLRVHQADLATVPTKVFAEESMYFGLAVAFLLAAAGMVFELLQFASSGFWSVVSFLVLVLLVAACVYLGVRQRATFAMLVHGLKNKKRSQVKSGGFLI